MNVPKSKKDAARGAWDAAESFAEAAEVLAKELQAKTKGAPAGLPGLGAPLAVADSFATELYLKALYTLECGKNVRGHHLKELFEELPSATQNCVRQCYNIRLKQQSIVGMSPSAQPLTQFDSCLAHSSQVFEKMRYIYEWPNLLLFYWPLLRLSVRDTIIAMCPDWAV